MLAEPTLARLLLGVSALSGVWFAVLWRRSEGRRCVLLATLDAAADGIVAINNAGRIVAYNNKFAEMWPIPDSSMAQCDGEKAVAHILPRLKDPDSFLSLVMPLEVSPTTPRDAELECRDGRVLKRHAEPLLSSGKVVGRVCSFRDVTARRKLRALLAQNQERLDALMNELPHAIYFKDCEGRGHPSQERVSGQHEP
jgi:PAS domain-containing protein